jgi:hypothetical protein
VEFGHQLQYRHFYPPIEARNSTARKYSEIYSVSKPYSKYKCSLLAKARVVYSSEAAIAYCGVLNANERLPESRHALHIR